MIAAKILIFEERVPAAKRELQVEHANAGLKAVPRNHSSIPVMSFPHCDVAGTGRAALEPSGAPTPFPVDPGKQSQFPAAAILSSKSVAFPQSSQSGDAPMTASVQNTRSAFKVLHNGLKWFREATHETIEDRVSMLETLVRSAEKCLDSIAAQIRFYQSADGTGRAYWIEIDGEDKHVSAQHLKTLRLALPGREEDAVIHGKPEALEAVAAALNAAGEKVTGPATLHEIADQLAEAAFAASGEPPDNRKAKANGST